MSHLGELHAGASAFTAHLAEIERHARRRRRRRRIGATVVVVALLGSVATFAAHEYRLRFAPASVDVIGSWSLQQIDRDGYPTVVGQDLPDRAGGVALQFTAEGGFLMAGGCAPTSGDYRVTSDRLTFSNTASTAIGCGYTTADSQRVATAIAEATNQVLDNGGVVSTPSPDRLDVSATGGDVVLHYVRNPFPQPGQRLPS